MRKVRRYRKREGNRLIDESFRRKGKLKFFERMV